MYLVIMSDRHTGDCYALYTNKEVAITRARKEAGFIAKHYRQAPEENLTEAMERAGWCFYAYLEDAGSVTVQEIQVEKGEG